jgi:hypothetical protein
MASKGGQEQGHDGAKKLLGGILVLIHSRQGRTGGGVAEATDHDMVFVLLHELNDGANHWAPCVGERS